jgi:hypothetical protein
LPLGAALIGLSNVMPVVFITFSLVVVLQQSHNLSPIVVSWGHRRFREHMLEHWIKFVAIPALILVVSVGVGWLSGILYPTFFPFYGTKIGVFELQGWQSPLGLMLGLYFIWNTWHFAKQNFGVLSIYRIKSGSGHRTIDLVYALSIHIAATLIGVLMMLGLVSNSVMYVCVFGALAAAAVMLSFETRLSPRIAFIITDASRLVLGWTSGLWSFAISGMNHWLVAIGLSSHVHARDRSAVAFSTALLGLGTIVFALLFVALPFCGLHSTSGPVPLPWWVRATMPAVSLRLGLGFVHFLYDRWLWKLSDPVVRSTIGADLFQPPPAALGGGPSTATKPAASMHALYRLTR